MNSRAGHSHSLFTEATSTPGSRRTAEKSRYPPSPAKKPPPTNLGFRAAFKAPLTLTGPGSFPASDFAFDGEGKSEFRPEGLKPDVVRVPGKDCFKANFDRARRPRRPARWTARSKLGSLRRVLATTPRPSSLCGEPSSRRDFSRFHLSLIGSFRRDFNNSLTSRQPQASSRDLKPQDRPTRLYPTPGSGASQFKETVRGAC
jgi:hypothetical protein